MAGATHDQWVAIKRWLVREFNPKYDIPATHLLPQKMSTGHRHGSTLPPLHWAGASPFAGSVKPRQFGR
jgi:hypothetical protein